MEFGHFMKFKLNDPTQQINDDLIDKIMSGQKSWNATFEILFESFQIFSFDPKKIEPCSRGEKSFFTENSRRKLARDIFLQS